jgi:hypothetical protein
LTAVKRRIKGTGCVGVREKGTGDIAEGISAVSDVGRGNFILVKLTGKGAFLIAQFK